VALRVGIVGGTGFYSLPSVEPIDVETPYGAVVLGRTKLGGREAFFLPRHGSRHERPPHRVNHRANIAALASAHCDYVIGVLNAGSLVKAVRPGAWGAMVDFVNLHRTGLHTFFEDRAVHVDFSEPVCPHVWAGLDAGGARHKFTYAGVDGPRFETPAETRLLTSSGAHVVGMTGVPEATLAHEKGLCYGALVFVGNYATGIGPGTTAQAIQEKLVDERGKLVKVLGAAVRKLATTKTCRCAQAAGRADITVEAMP